MIDYDTGKWGLKFVLTCRGSVFPKAFVWAFPAALACLIINTSSPEAWHQEFSQLSEASFALTLAATYNGVLGFLVVFRSQLAYARWWEGGTLLQQLRGEWFNAYSNLIAFCTMRDDRQQQVEDFQQLLVRLMSLLYGFALQQVSAMQQKEFEIFDLEGVDTEHLMFLDNSMDKCEITLQWIQRLVVQHSASGTIEIAPPILSRVFQELSRGIVNLNNARKIAEFPFPFPWPQMITVMLMIQVIVTPVMGGIGIRSPTIGCILTFLVVFASFGIHYIAQELENPYGDDPNDLPLREMQMDMNKSLMRLLEPHAQMPPKYTFVAKVSWGNLRQTGTFSVADLAEQSSSMPVTRRIYSHTSGAADKIKACCCRCCFGRRREGEDSSATDTSDPKKLSSIAEATNSQQTEARPSSPRKVHVERCDDSSSNVVKDGCSSIGILTPHDSAEPYNRILPSDIYRPSSGSDTCDEEPDPPPRRRTAASSASSRHERRLVSDPISDLEQQRRSERQSQDGTNATVRGRRHGHGRVKRHPLRLSSSKSDGEGTGASTALVPLGVAPVKVTTRTLAERRSSRLVRDERRPSSASAASAPHICMPGVLQIPARVVVPSVASTPTVTSANRRRPSLVSWGTLSRHSQLPAESSGEGYPELMS